MLEQNTHVNISTTGTKLESSSHLLLWFISSAESLPVNSELSAIGPECYPCSSFHGSESAISPFARWLLLGSQSMLLTLSPVSLSA